MPLMSKVVCANNVTRHSASSSPVLPVINWRTLPAHWAAHACVAAHELAARLEVAGIPVLLDVAALVHVVEAHDLPVRHVGYNRS